MNVSWMIPLLSQPSLRFVGGDHDLHFPGTGGWTYEEAAWTGAQSKGVVFEVATWVPKNSDVLVLSPEAQALSVLSKEGDFHAKRILVRVVGRPKPVDVWHEIAKIAPRVHSWCCIGKAEAEALHRWLLWLGLKPNIHIVPLGAETSLPDFNLGRAGIAYLGSAHHQKRVPTVVQAAAMAEMPIHLGLSLTNEAAAETLQEIGDVATRYGAKLFVGEFGIEGRAKLLSSVRAVVTASVTDDQWLPGTEGRARGAVAIANDQQLQGWSIREANGDAMLYFDMTAENLAEKLREYVLDDVNWEKEARRQHSAFLESGRSSTDVGKALWAWVEEALL